MPRLATVLLLSLFALPAASQRAPCENGFAQPEGSTVAYPCDRVDFMGRLSLEAMGNAFRGNDIWGWTDGQTGNEYALVGLQGSTAFADVTDPENPVYLGKLPTHTTSSVWRDIKVYADHAYVVSEASGHGMQVFDLTQLRDVTTPELFEATAHYDGVSGSHNIVVNEDTGFAYIVGADAGADLGCSGGLHMVDLTAPTEPAFAGCFADDGYTHDAQCVVYDGPDTDYTGREMCFAFNTDKVTIADVTDKAAPAFVSSAIYPNIGYTHQGWLTEDQRYLIGNDEADESTFGINTRTLIFDVSDLDAPEFVDAFSHDTPAIDHNLYVVGSSVYETNDAAGLRILDASALLSDGGSLEAAGYFDTYPESDAPVFEGTWSNYPFFASGNVIVNDRSRGLFVLQPQRNPPTALDDAQPDGFELTSAYPNPFSSATRLTLRVTEPQTVRIDVFDGIGRRMSEPFAGVVAAGERREVEVSGAGWPAGIYFIRVAGETFAATRQITLVR